MPKPSLVVFDLDFTLWDAGGLWCDCLNPPFQKASEGGIFDSDGREIRLYSDVPKILDTLGESGVPMGLASRTNEPSWARELLDLLGIASRFELQEIYPSSKVRHFDSLKTASGVPLDEMLFFDDEMRNIDEVGAMGVKTVYVESGLSWKLFEEGLERFD